jgi:hypothetical protein
MNKDLFMKIVFGITEYADYFIYKHDCTGLWGYFSIQKCTAALRCLAYGDPPDAADDYLCMAESTCSKTIYMFWRVAITVFAGHYFESIEGR